MNQYDVSVVRCGDYDDESVESALRDALDPIGGLDFVQPGMTVGIKVNLVSAMKPESAATVHPAVVCALIRLLREKGDCRLAASRFCGARILDQEKKKQGNNLVKKCQRRIDTSFPG